MRAYAKRLEKNWTTWSVWQISMTPWPLPAPQLQGRTILCKTFRWLISMCSPSQQKEKHSLQKTSHLRKQNSDMCSRRPSSNTVTSTSMISKNFHLHNCVCLWASCSFANRVARLMMFVISQICGPFTFELLDCFLDTITPSHKGHCAVGVMNENRVAFYSFLCWQQGFGNPLTLVDVKLTITKVIFVNQISDLSSGRPLHHHMDLEIGSMLSRKHKRVIIDQHIHQGGGCTDGQA